MKVRITIPVTGTVIDAIYRETEKTVSWRKQLDGRHYTVTVWDSGKASFIGATQRDAMEYCGFKWVANRWAADDEDTTTPKGTKDTMLHIISLISPDGELPKFEEITEAAPSDAQS